MREEKKDWGLSLGCVTLDYFHHIPDLKFFIFSMSSFKNSNQNNTQSSVITTLPPEGPTYPHPAI